MKRIVAFIIILVCVFAFACDKWEPTVPDETLILYQEEISSLADIKGHVTKLELLEFGVGGENQRNLTADADKYVERFSKIVLLRSTDMEACDSDEFYTFRLDDGTERNVCFNGGNLRFEGSSAKYGPATYEINGYVSSYAISGRPDYYSSDCPDVYWIALEDILSAMDSCDIGSMKNYCHGEIKDIWGTEIPEMFIVYTPDGKTLHAAVYSTGNGTEPDCIDRSFGELAGSACVEILVDNTNSPVIYMLYTNYDGEEIFGTLETYTIEDAELKLSEETDFRGDEEFSELVSGKLCSAESLCSFDENGSGSPLSWLIP